MEMNERAHIVTFIGSQRGNPDRRNLYLSRDAYDNYITVQRRLAMELLWDCTTKDGYECLLALNSFMLSDDEWIRFIGDELTKVGMSWCISRIEDKCVEFELIDAAVEPEE